MVNDKLDLGLLKSPKAGSAESARVTRLKAGSGDTSNIDPVLIWPPKITLKADNGLYVSRILRGGQDNLEPAKSIQDIYCEFTVTEVGDHLIALKGDNGKYLSRINRGKVDNMEFAKDKVDEYCKFRYCYISDHIVSLKSDNGKFLSRIDNVSQQNIEAAKPTIDQYCKFEVGENIIGIEFEDIVYDLDNASVTDEEALVSDLATIHNSEDTDLVKTISFRYMKSVIGTVNTEIGIMIGAKAGFKSKIPFLGESEVELSTEVHAFKSFGESNAVEKEITDTTQVVIPKHTQGTIQVVVKRALLDVHFTYTIVRQLTNGEVTRQPGQKGVYENVESFSSDVVLKNFVPC